MLRRLITLAIVLPPVIAGCGEMRLVDDLPPATLLTSYQAQISAERAKPPIRYDLFGGELPDGLELAGDGTLTGVPVGLGSYPFEVRAIDDNDRWVVATLHLEVEADPAEVFLGPVLDEEDLNGICVDGYTDDVGEVHRLLCQPWVRIQGAGMPGQSERALVAGVFWVGDNGQPDGGWYDDLLLRTLDPDEVVWSFEPGEFWPEAIEAGPNSPTDTTVDGTGLLGAGESTGPGTVQVSHETFGVDGFEVLVVPPDFCPAPQGC